MPARHQNHSQQAKQSWFRGEASRARRMCPHALSCPPRSTQEVPSPVPGLPGSTPMGAESSILFPPKFNMGRFLEGFPNCARFIWKRRFSFPKESSPAQERSHARQLTAPAAWYPPPATERTDLRMFASQEITQRGCFGETTMFIQRGGCLCIAWGWKGRGRGAAPARSGSHGRIC